LLHRLTEQLGLVPGGGEESLSPALRAGLKRIGVRAGRFALFLPALLKPQAAATRARLWALVHGVPVPGLPAPGLVSLPAPSDWPPGFAAAMGWLEAGPALLRLDIAERVAAELAWASRRGATALPAALGSRFSVKAELLPVVLRRLGFRILPARGLGAEEYGPPAPAMLAPLRRPRPPASAPPAQATHAHGPFAALAVLKR
jgi:ATP-dependent RNA helicase SUPV3L1/SUV3